MWDKIIVPMDGSTTAEVALPYAIEFAARSGAELVLLFVKEPNDYRSDHIINAYLTTLAQRTKEEVQQYSKETGVNEIKTRGEILTGNPADEILAFAEKNPNSKILMATHGQSGIGTRWALGSVADKVARATTVPITLIRAKRDRAAIRPKGMLKSILAPVDGSKLAEATLPYVRDMALQSQAEVVFLQVLEKKLVTHKMIEVPVPEETRQAAKEYLERLVNDFKKAGVSARYEIEETRGDVAGEIVEYTEKKKVDLVIMATHGFTGLRRWVMGSVTSKVIREGNSPIMLVRPTGGYKD
ncbi:MAG: universal stress protein [Dehalococcoidales bacterium]|nr:universal stress protein [Dehalococcoidales bacterium]